jgi:hypothetical protein
VADNAGEKEETWALVQCLERRVSYFRNTTSEGLAIITNGGPSFFFYYGNNNNIIIT